MFSLAHAHGYLKISRNPLLRVYRDVPVKDVSTHESEIDALHVIKRLMSTVSYHSQTSKIDTHKSPVSACFSDDFDENDVILVQADLSVPPLMRSDLLLETIGAASFEGDLLPIAMETSCQSGETGVWETRAHCPAPREGR